MERFIDLRRNINLPDLNRFIKVLCNQFFFSFFTPLYKFKCIRKIAFIYDLLKFKTFKTEDEARFHAS